MDGSMNGCRVSGGCMSMEKLLYLVLIVEQVMMGQPWSRTRKGQRLRVQALLFQSSSCSVICVRVWNCEIFLLEISNRLERKSERQASSRSPRWSGKDPMGDTRDSSSWRRLASARVWIVWLGTTLGVGVRMTLASPTSNTVAPKIEPTKRSRLDFPAHGPYSSNPRNSLARHFSILS